MDVPGYAPGYATLSGLRRGPESLGGRSRGSGRSSNRSLTRSEINEVLRGATSKIVGDLTQEIREKLEPLMIPPQASPTTVGVSPHRVQANHLVAGLTNTLGGLRSRPMPTPAAIPRSPFVPRTAQPPYSHVTNSTRAELDQLGLTALRPDRWVIHGTNSLLTTDYTPPHTQPRPRHVRQGGRPGRPPHLGHMGTQILGHAALHPQRLPGPW